MTKKKRKVNTKRIAIVALIPVVCIALLIANFTSIRLSIKGYHKEDKKVVLKLEKEDIKDILQYDQIIDISKWDKVKNDAHYLLYDEYYRASKKSVKKVVYYIDSYYERMEDLNYLGYTKNVLFKNSDLYTISNLDTLISANVPYKKAKKYLAVKGAQIQDIKKYVDSGLLGGVGIALQLAGRPVQDGRLQPLLPGGDSQRGDGLTVNAHRSVCLQRHGAPRAAVPGFHPERIRARRQLKLLQAVQATGKPVVLVLINGRPLSINWADKFVPAIVEAWYPGSKGGTAVADVLFGDYNPGGKLTVTFPKSVGQIPFNFPCKPSSQVDGGKNPGPDGNMSRVNGALYPFGYGLSYTTFEYSDLKISPAVITPNETVTVTLNVTNTGSRAGDEVVQLYTRDVVSSVTTYEKNLAGFERIHLQPGETKQVTFHLDRKQLELLNADMKWVVEPGEFVVMAAASSEDIRQTTILRVENYATRNARLEAEKPENPVTASTNPESALHVLDGDNQTFWQGNKGDYLTFALKGNPKVDEVTVTFTRDNKLPANFEIQLSGGGGQFLTVYSGTVSEYNKPHTYTFHGTTASDLRILLNDDRVGIAEVNLKLP